MTELSPLCHYDVVIVGAGFSGLQAARLLARKYSVLLLEAGDQVGGRVRNHTFANGDTVDIGGQWLGPGQDRMYQLAAELHCDIFPLYNRGDNLFHDGVHLHRYHGTIPKLKPHVLLDLGRMIRRFERLAHQVDPAKPWAHPRAAQWDAMTLHSWIERTGWSAQAREVFRIGIGAVFAAEPHEISFLHALFYAAAGDSLEHLLAVAGGAQQDRIHGGTWAMCKAMADILGDACQLNAVVESISYKAESVSVCYRQQGAAVCVSARSVILAIPPNQINRLQFDPPLPAWRDQLFQRMPGASCIKCVARYDQAFWRDQRLSGQVASTRGPVRVVFDNGEKGKSAGLLMGFVEGDTAREWSDKPEAWIQQQVLDAFARFFGEQALRPTEFAMKNWAAEPYIRGCYAALMGPGVWTGAGKRLRTPEGPIHFAGTEMATEWYGYMEGALQAGERAASEVHSHLSRHLEKAIK